MKELSIAMLIISFCFFCQGVQFFGIFAFFCLLTVSVLTNKVVYKNQGWGLGLDISVSRQSRLSY